MTKARRLWPRWRGGKNAENARNGRSGGGGRSGNAGSTATAPPDGTPPRDSKELEECLRACAVHSDRLTAAGTENDRKRADLAAKLRRLRDVHASAHASAASEPAGNELFDALLAAGTAALECGDGGGRDGEGDGGEPALALLISATVLAERGSSRAGWRLRARTLEAAGDEQAAVEAYERYLALTETDWYGVAPRLAGLRTAARQQEDMLRLLARECPRAEEFATAPASAAEVRDVWEEGLRLHDKGDRTQAEPRLVGALLAMGRDRHPVGELQNAVGHYLDLRVAAADGDASGLRELIGHYAEQRRNRMRPPLTDPTLGGVDWIGVGELRNLIAGKSVCLVANSESLGRGSLGPEIDAYDLVVRFSSYRIDAPATGTRTDLHATAHEHGFNWDRPVTTRMVFGGSAEKWSYSLRERLVPGAQRYVTDESVRWPLRHLGGVDWDAWPSVPTSGFNTLWLLDFLDVSPALDLFGFDFYESGVHRLPGAMRVPVTSERERTSEKAWVMERAQSVNDMRISLR
ncbi:hypothetical protein ACFV9P_08030 [Streptomyces sp. NPDC059892]|uniref:hypothetical protein n=1 Tax=Streptomyces sp. NPDC059892 TaxID=3346989 RepID=UPI003659DA39